MAYAIDIASEPDHEGEVRMIVPTSMEDDLAVYVRPEDFRALAAAFGYTFTLTSLPA